MPTSTGWGQAAVLGEHWGHVFSGPVEDPKATEELLWHAVPFEWVLYEHPSLDDVRAVLDRMSDSAPGPDGAPESVWRAGWRMVAKAIHTLVVAMFRGEPLRLLSASVKEGPARACADDAALGFAGERVFPPVAAALKTIDDVAGMTVHPPRRSSCRSWRWSASMPKASPPAKT